MKRLVFVILVAFVMNISCQRHERTSNLQLNQHQKQLLFFSDEHNIQNEDAYYDALLEIKKDYPSIVSNMMVISSNDNRDLGKYEVNTYPTLMVVYQNQIITKINGNMKTQDIIDPIVKVLKDSKSK